jgi:hypothetical protein
MASRTRSCKRSVKRFWNGCFAACLIVASVFSWPASGEPPAAPAAADAPAAINFELQIRPLLVGRCGDCHGPDTQESHLRLDVKHRALKGGDFGPVIVAGKSGDSELIRRITSTDDKKMMPPDGDRLSAAEIALVQQWIDSGAAWPESEADRLAREGDRDPRLDHWAWQPVARPAVPTAPAADAPVRNDIDRFIQFKLAASNLSPAPEADRRTLIRRLSFDLLGLPPTPEDVAAFVADESPDAYEKLVDRLVASPHYGERWARHWLDIAHYADTHGFERDQLRPNAWRYRDWVIKAFNADLPYDEFLRRQIAGDVVAPDDADAVIATGFLAAGPWDFVGQVETKSDVLRRQARADDLDDMITQVMTSCCGVTINCARCHDHKLDPIPQRDYYSLVSVFAGVKRGDRPIDTERSRADRQLAAVEADIASLLGPGIDLADIVGGGDGRGTGTPGFGVEVVKGEAGKAGLNFLKTEQPNVLLPPMPVAGTTLSTFTPAFIKGVFVPKGIKPDGKPPKPDSPPTELKLAENVVITDLPPSSGQSWDRIRNGKVSHQPLAKAFGIDFTTDGHSVLGLHSNSGITFDLAEIRQAHSLGALRLTATVGFGSAEVDPSTKADFSLYLDAERKLFRAGLRKDQALSVVVEIPESVRFLTLVTTDGGDGIGMDQLFLGDARLRPVANAALSPPEIARLEQLEVESGRLQQKLRDLAELPVVYALTNTQLPKPVRVQRRGNPEDETDEVVPGALSLNPQQPATLGDNTTPEGQRRRGLAEWITSPANPLTPRVLVNRLWHHHFGTGLVDTPSDFGLGGGKPSHPELLDWLADDFIDRGWSLKAMHRLICTSHTYRQRSVDVPRAAAAAAIDADNRLLWRQNARRLDAESLRDATLAVTGSLNPEMEGPGYRDFKYTEAYAPVYEYIAADSPELWRRSIYRFIVRSTPHAFMTTLDCPNPANLAPARLETTTALQSLALLNNDFMLRQAGHWAKRLEKDAGADPVAQVRRGFALALARQPNDAELTAAVALVEKAGLVQFCRMLLNANEFVYID